MKRVLSILLAISLTLCATLPAGALTAADFTDVPDNWARPAIAYCLEKGLMSGVGNGKFNPGGSVSRAQIAQVLYNRENNPSVDGLANPFTDVGSQWFANAVVWCKANGIVNGSSASTFSPNGEVTRQDICVMVYNYYTKHLGKTPEMAEESQMAATFADWGKVAGYAKNAIRWANQVGFMRGSSGTTLDPAGKATRAQLAQFLRNLETVLEKEPEPTASPNPTAEPTASPEPTKEPTPTPVPTVEPTATPAPTATPVPTPTAPPADLFPLAIQKMPIAAGPNQTLAVNSDGTVRGVGLNEMGCLNVQDWTDIVALTSLRNVTMGLKSNGTVVTTLARNRSEIEALRDVVSIADVSGLNSFSAALHSDGTVTVIDSRGSQKLDWTNIVQICAGRSYLVGVRADGTVSTVGSNFNKDGCLEVEDWTDIKFVAAGLYTTVGVKKDGTVVATGEKVYGKLDVEDWTDIVSVACGNTYTLGLRADGTVVATGLNGYGQMNVEGWRDIVALSVCGVHTVGLRADGTLLVIGANGNGQCEANGWTGIMMQ